MAGFFKGISAALKAGKKAGTVVKIIEEIAGRPLSGVEREDVKDFYDRLDPPESRNEGLIALDYFTLLIGNSNPSGASMTNDAKENIIDAIHLALLRGTIQVGNGPNSEEQIHYEIKALRLEAGLSL